MAFIYQIRKTDSELCYVGHTTKSVEVRWAAHLALLSVGKHHSRYLQNAWKKYGPGAFSFELIEECPDDDKLVREQFFIDTLVSVFNTARVSGSRLGVLFTEEQKIALSAQRMGHSVSDEARRKIGAAHAGRQWKLGYKLTEEQRARCSAAQTGVARPYAAANAAIARRSSPANKPGWIPLPRIGAKDSPEVIEKRRLAVIQAIGENPTIWINDGNSSKKHPLLEEIPYGWERGRIFSADHKTAVLASSSGPRSAEVKAAIKAGHADTWSDPDKRAAMMANRRPFGWWTDGTSSKRVPVDEKPPEGWRPGRAIDTEKLISSRAPRPKRVAVSKVLLDT